MKSFRLSSLFILLLTVFGLSVLHEPVFAKPSDQDRWNKKYGTEKFIFGKRPTRFIENNFQLLPKGKTLDIAMGEGRNGVFLATQGFDVTGVDISDVGLEKARQLAEANGVTIQTKVMDLENDPLEKNAYDLVVCTYYLQRDLFAQMKEAVRPGGMVLVETYNMDYLNYARFNKNYLLETNELLEVFKDFKIIRYEAYDDGKEAYSAIIAQRP
ncbi:MAG: class I SAM-dependent methyltransferase [Candidatus Nitrohelix vancouverensis]|uniref:Class I SAM-dependent methyltransferase n=1 Tax=Candidatus Nitrohelix vancouverensis TaxID=2705534 RepID=A0A7T0C065_9BACT|nr:MAG: class I SAM-dependent methyltransferase [Candidatus Nitrohelix vancouverensis]